jgi:GNAT superfamily N-acetyltransferase
MTTTTTTIRRAAADDFENLAQLLTVAFLDSPLSTWLIDDRETRAAICPPYFEIFVEHTLTHGRIDAAGDVAAAFWLPTTGDHPLTPIRDYDTRLAAIAGGYLPRLQLLDTARHANRITGAHDYLAFLAVHPDARNQGLGSALLDRHHQRLDAAALPAYLEATGLVRQPPFVIMVGVRG